MILCPQLFFSPKTKCDGSCHHYLCMCVCVFIFQTFNWKKKKFSFNFLFFFLTLISYNVLLFFFCNFFFFLFSIYFYFFLKNTICVYENRIENNLMREKWKNYFDIICYRNCLIAVIINI